jgi:hypothetical protein
MMTDKQPNQAMPSGKGGAAERDGVWNTPGKGNGGESGGGSYDSPRNEPGGDNGGFMGHGGQTDIGYSGTGQGGSDDDKDVGNANAPTKAG